MDHIYSTFSENFKLTSKESLPDRLELFNFDKTSLQVIIRKEHYVATLENLIDYYIEYEEYEICNNIKKIINTLIDATE